MNVNLVPIPTVVNRLSQPVEYLSIRKSRNPSAGGAEARLFTRDLLNSLFNMYDIDAKGPFRVAGEQIDGAFTFEDTEFLLEAKWRSEKTAASDLDTFAGKIGRRLDNTLGMFLSMNGYHDTAESLHSQARAVMILMDGADLSAVVEGRISMPELLSRRRRHAARTGEILLNAYQVL